MMAEKRLDQEEKKLSARLKRKPCRRQSGIGEFDSRNRSAAISRNQQKQKGGKKRGNCEEKTVCSRKKQQKKNVNCEPLSLKRNRVAPGVHIPQKKRASAGTPTPSSLKNANKVVGLFANGRTRRAHRGEKRRGKNGGKAPQFSALGSQTHCGRGTKLGSAKVQKEVTVPGRQKGRWLIRRKRPGGSIFLT